MKKLLIILMLLSSVVRADNNDTLHFTAGYTLQTFMYGMSKKALRLETHEAIIFSFVTVGFLGLVKEATDRKPSGNDLFYNTVGQASSIGTCLMFDF